MAVALKPFSIGDVQVDFPVVLGGMAGYTDLPYRLICRAHGSEYCTSEMMLDRSVLSAPKVRSRIAASSEADHPVAGQLIGNDPETLAAAARKLSEIGFDVIDLNFACPVNKALKRRRGGYLMTVPKLIVEIVRTVVRAVDRPVTLKLRRKFAESDDDSAFYEIAQGAFDSGASAITVHARSVEVKYASPADWTFLLEVKRCFPERTILGSGDILTPRAAIDVLRETGVDGVIIARGALGNPWFFREVRGIAANRKVRKPTLAEQREVLERHFAGACELYGPVRGPKIMRKFGIKYASLHPTPRIVRMGFVNAKSPPDWFDILGRFYSS